MRRLLITLLAVLSAGVVGIHAYSTRGYFWGVSTVRYYVNPQNVYVPEAEAIAAIRSGADAWNSQSNANIHLDYAGTSSGSSLTLNGVNEVFFRNDASGYIAEAYWWYDGTGHLIDADIVFHENYAFYTTLTGCSNGYYIENTATHEFGHVLGLAHSDAGEATMWPYSGSCETVRMTLDSDDVAGIESLYPPSQNGGVVVGPDAPSDPIPTNNATGVSTSPTLSWVAAGAESYDIYLNGALYWANWTTAAFPPSISLAGLASGTTYTWSVVAKNSDGSTSGPTWKFTTATTTGTTSPKKGKGANRR